MSAKLDETRVTRKYDRRIKLSDDDKEEIVALYKLGATSYNKLAREFGVSKRTIYWIVNPEKLEENKRLRAERGGSKYYYDKETQRKAMRDHRDYKRSLLEEGKI